MSPAKPPLHFQFVDALRGYAVLGVILLHVGQLIPDTYPCINRVASYGGTGVQLFFIISAFSLFWSLKNRSETDRHPLKAFYIRRIFRVVPLFWCGILFYLGHPDFWRDQFAPNGVGLPQVLTSILFVHGWYPSTINSVVPGGWSIAAEMMFYLTLPWLFRLIRSFCTAVVLATGGSIIAMTASPTVVRLLSAHFPPAWAGLISLFVSFSFPAQFPVFCWGIVLYFLVLDQAANPWRRLVVLLVCALPFLAGPAYLLLSILFTLFAKALAIRPVSIFVHRSLRFVGLVSYSIYLWHFFVLDWIAPLLAPSLSFTSSHKHLAATFRFGILYLTIAATSILVASVSYHLIERPFIRVGRWLIGRLNWGPARGGQT